jgi:predicted acyl esterase
MNMESWAGSPRTRSAEQIEVLFRTPRPVTDPKGHYPGFQRAATALKAGTVVKRGHKALTRDVLFERDVAVQMRDGTTLYVDIFRPAGGTGVPAIVAWSPYGKGGGGNQSLDDIPFRAGVSKAAVSGLQKFEGPDPAHWCAYGYAIVNPDSRGAYMSEGDIRFWGTQDAQDGYDLIEWVAGRDWSNGKVGMAGNSWLAIAQWFIAAQRPPHLAAIAPWEGVTDLYRHDVYRGGIPDTGFCDSMTALMCGSGRVEDVPAMVCRHPLMNEYWKDKQARPERIDVPAYVTASWANPVHTIGTFEGFERLGSREKWLRVHNTFEWPDFYSHQDDLRRFFDHYLRGVDSGWKTTPRVRLSILDMGGKDDVDRPESEFPPVGTEYRPLYLDADGGSAGGSLSFRPPSEQRSARYRGDDGGQTVFTYVFDRDVELIGHLKLRLWVEAQGSEDMDLFIKVQKLNRNGKLLFSPTIPVANPVLRKVLPFLYRRGVKPLSLLFFSGPDGRLRVSRRALDDERSTEEQPHLAHDRDETLSPGEIVPVEIGLRPVGMRWRAGEQLRLVVAGYNLSPIPLSGIAPPELVNRGTHVIHTGGRYDSHLLIPMTPSGDPRRLP